MSRWFTLYTEVLVRVVPESDYALALEQLAEAMPLEVAAVDRTGRVIVWNRAIAAEVTPRETVLGRPLLDVFPGSCGPTATATGGRALDRVLREGPALEFRDMPLAERVVRAVTLTPLQGADDGVDPSARGWCSRTSPSACGPRSAACSACAARRWRPSAPASRTRSAIR